MTKKWKKWIYKLFYKVGVNGVVQRVRPRGGRWLYVLAYHRVCPPEREPLLGRNLISAAPDQFEAQMQLISLKYHPVTSGDVLSAVDQDRSLPRDAVLVTVDDGYRDFLEVVFPIVKRYGIQPVLFVSTLYIERGMFWWDRLAWAVRNTQVTAIETPLGPISLGTEAEREGAVRLLSKYVRQHDFERAKKQIESLCEELAPGMLGKDHRIFLTWDELRALASSGVTIASHTHTHPILSHISLENARRELRISQELIEDKIGHSVPIFAFPDGRPYSMNAQLLRLLRSEGFKLAFTRVEGRARLEPSNLLQLPRIGVSHRSSLSQFHLHLTPAYHVWKQMRQ